MEYINVRKTGLLAIGLREDDELIEVKVTDESDLIYLVSQKGMSICFKQDNVRATGRTSMGVIGMDLDEDDLIVGMQVSSQGEAVLIVSEKVSESEPCWKNLMFRIAAARALNAIRLQIRQVLLWV